MLIRQILFISAIGSNSPKASDRKHLILSKLPRTRSFRILKNLNDSRTLRVLGRDHANSILSGVSSSNSSRKNSKAVTIGKILIIDDKLSNEERNKWLKLQTLSFQLKFII